MCAGRTIVSNALLGEWCRARSADDIVTVLWEAGVPVGTVMQPHDQPDLPQLAARGFFEELDHPVIGASWYSTFPMRFSKDRSASTGGMPRTSLPSGP